MRGLNYPLLTNQRPQRLMGTSLRVILKLYRGLMAPHAGQLVTKYWLWDQSITERSEAKIMNSLCVTGDKTQSLGNPGTLWDLGWKVKVLDMLCLLDIFIFKADDATERGSFQHRYYDLSHATWQSQELLMLSLRDRAYRSSWQGSCELIEHCWMSVTDSLMRLILDITQRELGALWTLKRSLGGYFVCCFTGI